MNEEKLTSKNKIFHYLKFITVEPTLILYMLAFMTTSVVEQAFFVDKSCKVTHGFNSTICDNIYEKIYEEYNKKVQLTVSDFYLWNDITAYSGQIFMAFFMGAWSDKRGRKLPLLLGLCGKLYYSSMIVVNSMRKMWPVEYITYTATLPMTFIGADVAIFASAYSYLIDITDQKSRTMRITILDFCYLVTMPSGIALGSYLFRNLMNKSYTKMFLVNMTLMIISIIYTMVRLKWKSSPTQKPLSKSDNLCLDFFDYEHLINTSKTLFKKRTNNRRCYLLMLIIMISLYTFQRDEKNMNYLYTQLVFNWSFQDISMFRTFSLALQDVVMLTAVPVLTLVLGWRDAFIILLGSLSHSVARIFYATATTSWLFYTGSVFAAFGPVVGPVIKSMVSKLVAPSEKGKAMSLLSVASNGVPIVSGVLYTRLYKATLNVWPSAVFYLTITTQLAVFLSALYIHFKAKERDLVHDEEVNLEMKAEAKELLQVTTQKDVNT